MFGPQSDYPTGKDDPRATFVKQREQTARDEQAIGDRFRALLLRGKKFRDAWTEQTIAEHREAINEAMIRAMVDPQEFAGLGKEGMEQFLYDLPVASAVHEIRYRRSRTSLPWKSQDLLDLHALATAVVHCDIVVAETAMANVTRDAKLDTRHGTTSSRTSRG